MSKLQTQGRTAQPQTEFPWKNLVSRQPYDFAGAKFDLSLESDREIVSFILSQALYGEATGVYCGQSLYSANSLQAAHFYTRQARQELRHLELFAEIFRLLELSPQDGHWVLKLLSSHNHYYPLKVLMEHAVGEGLVLDVFRNVLMHTLDDADPRVAEAKKKLEAICREEEEHVAWGEAETRRLLSEKPWLRLAYRGLVSAQLALIPSLLKPLSKRYRQHPVMKQLPAFVAHCMGEVEAQLISLGIRYEEPDSRKERGLSYLAGTALYLGSRFARSKSRLPKIYLKELGF